MPAGLQDQIDLAKRNQAKFWMLSVAWILVCGLVVFALTRVSKQLDERQREGQTLLTMLREQQATLARAIDDAAELRRNIDGVRADLERERQATDQLMSKQRAQMNALLAQLGELQASNGQLNEQLRRQVQAAEEQAQLSRVFASGLKAQEDNAKAIVDRLAEMESAVSKVVTQVSEMKKLTAIVGGGDAELDLAIGYLRRNQTADSLPVFDRIIRSPEATPQVKFKARIYAGFAQLLLKKFALAAEVLSDAIADEQPFAAASADEQALAYRLRGTAYSLADLDAKAKPDLIRALELNPEDGRAAFALSQVLHALDEIPEALEKADLAIKLVPDDGDYWRSRGHLWLEHLDNPVRAEDDYRTALRLNEADTDARLNVAICRFIAGKESEAEQELNTVLGGSSANESVRLTAMAYLLLLDLQHGRYEQANGRVAALGLSAPPKDARLALAIAAVKAKNRDREGAQLYVAEWNQRAKSYYRRTFAAKLPADLQRLLGASGAKLTEE